jgi:hypothetical protein
LFEAFESFTMPLRFARFSIIGKTYDWKGGTEKCRIGMVCHIESSREQKHMNV